jgi:hypothetical protein
VTNWYAKGKRLVEVLSDTAVWHSTALPAVSLRWVLIRDPQGEFRTQALLCTELRADPERIISWFCYALADGGYLSRGTPALRIRDSEALVPKSNPENRSCAVGLVFSVVTLFAHQHMTKSAQTARRTSWYRKSYPTFSDALASVRKELWAQEETFCGSLRESDTL